VLARRGARREQRAAPCNDALDGGITKLNDLDIIEQLCTLPEA
jgi:hypothetical protein